MKNYIQLENKEFIKLADFLEVKDCLEDKDGYLHCITYIQEIDITSYSDLPNPKLFFTMSAGSLRIQGDKITWEHSLEAIWKRDGDQMTRYKTKVTESLLLK